MSGENIELVGRVFAAWRSGDAAELEELLAADVEWRPTPLSDGGAEVFRGLDGVREWAASVAARGGEVRNEIEEMRDLGDRVLVLGHVVERIGDEVRTDAHLAWLFEIRNDRLARGEGFLSRADAFRAAGIVAE